MEKIEPVIEAIDTAVEASELLVDGVPCCPSCYARAIANKAEALEAPEDSYIGKVVAALSHVDPSCVEISEAPIEEELL